ncbi:MAG: BspA family leucine-rich repeat surface protein [Clostridiales bacterium]|nr:BspA family leucine-rich repeat surface protein [Clostridiales bacterium]
MRDMELYTKMEQLGIEIEDVEIRLCVYVYKNTPLLRLILKKGRYKVYLGRHVIVTVGSISQQMNLEALEPLRFTYDDIESMEYITNCTEENAFSVGTIASAGFNFSIFEEKYTDDGDISYYDYDFAGAMVIPVYTFYYEEEELDTLQLGVFHVDSYVKEDEMIKFTCLDNATYLDQKIKKHIADEIGLPENMLLIIQDIVLTCGLGMGAIGIHGEIEFPTINNLSNLKNMTARTILSYMLELVGAFGYFTNEGEFVYKTFNASNEQNIMIPLDRVMEYKREGYSAIMNGARLVYDDRDMELMQAFWSDDYIPEDIDGDGENEYVKSLIPTTENNPLFAIECMSVSTIQDALHNLLSRMKNFNFKPGTVNTFLPDFRIEVGDFVAVEDKLQYTRKFLTSQITYQGNLEMEIVSAWDGETYNIKNDGSVFIGIKPIITTHIYDGYAVHYRLKALTGVTERDKEEVYDYGVKAILCKDKKDITIDPIEKGYPNSIISLDEEEFPVCAYLEGDTIIIFSEADIYETYSDNFQCMFSRFTKLEQLDLSKIDTSKAESMYLMFNGCATASDEVSINWGKHFDTSNVTEMRGMFQFFGRNVKNLFLNLSHFNTSNVHYMSFMFNQLGANSDTVELDISSFDVSTVLYMSSMFYGTAKNAKNVTFQTGDFYTLNVTDMSSMFSGGCNIKIVEEVVNNESFTTINVTNMSNMFADVGKNSENVTLDLTKLDTSNVTNMEGMFYGAGLNSTNFVIKLGEKFDMSKAKYKNGMFENHGISKILCPANKNISNLLAEVYDGVIETY